MGFKGGGLVTADEVSSGSFAGTYSINGLMTVGDPAHSHLALGTDTHGADGLRLYAADGVTPLIDLAPGVFTLRTGTGTNYWDITTANSDLIKGYTGDPNEHDAGYLQVGKDFTGGGSPILRATIRSPIPATTYPFGWSMVSALAASNDGSQPARVKLTAAGDATWDGNTLSLGNAARLAVRSLISSSEDRNTYNTPLTPGGTLSTGGLYPGVGIWDSGYVLLLAITARNVSGQWQPTSALAMFQVYREGGNAAVNEPTGPFAATGGNTITTGAANINSGINIRVFANNADGSSLRFQFKNNYPDPVQWIAEWFTLGAALN